MRTISELCFLSFLSSKWVRQRVKWKPPTGNRFKVSFDSVVFREVNEAGIDVVIRDGEGQVLASMA